MEWSSIAFFFENKWFNLLFSFVISYDTDNRETSNKKFSLLLTDFFLYKKYSEASGKQYLCAMIIKSTKNKKILEKLEKK